MNNAAVVEDSVPGHPGQYHLSSAHILPQRH